MQHRQNFKSEDFRCYIVSLQGGVSRKETTELGLVGGYYRTLVAAVEEVGVGGIEGVGWNIQVGDVALEDGAHAHVETHHDGLEASETSVGGLEVEAISIARAAELIGNDASRSLTNGAETGLFSEDSGVEVDLGDLAVQVAEGGGNSDVGVHEQEASQWIGVVVSTARAAEGVVVQISEGSTVPDLADGVVAGDTVFGGAHLVLSDNVDIGTTNGTKGLWELNIDSTTLVEQEGVEEVLGLTDLAELVSVQSEDERLSVAGSVASGVVRGLVARVLERVGIGNSRVTEAEGESEQVRDSWIN